MKVNRFFYFLIPNRAISLYHRTMIKRKFDVIMEKNSSAPGSFFEGKNRLNEGACVSNSYIGMASYISGNAHLRNVKIGRFCSIGRNVETGFGVHPTEFVSTHPAFYSTKKQAGFTFSEVDIIEEHKYVDTERKYFVEIGHNVWIGNDVKILDGITIGEGAIVALGSVVTCNIPPYTIVGGIPAKIIRTRMDGETYKKFAEMNIWDQEFSWYKLNIDFFRKKLNSK